MILFSLKAKEIVFGLMEYFFILCIIKDNYYGLVLPIDQISLSVKDI